ncbi:MAG: S8 family serine peptidase [Chloroflexota bacterium]|nr:S8 family serine peptidase [Chloroflexota bacterium]
MRWEDSWGGADCNLDLYLAKFVPGRGYEIVTIGNDEQDGQDSDVPRELVVYELPSVSEEGVYALFIVKRNCVNEPDWIQLEAWDIPELGYYSPGHHVGNPAESRNPGMLAVGATHWGSPGVIASYSSRGPTTDGRIKPDITGIACGRSTVYPPRTRDGTECWFPGTSQAAPHVSGLAALVKQRFPDYTPAQVADYLKKHADERDSLGADNTWGHGLAILPPAPEPTLRGSPPTPEFYVCPSNDPRCTDDIPEGQAIISWVPVPDATHYRIGYINMEVDLYLAEEASCTNEADDWLQAFIYVDVKAPNVPVRNGRAEWTIRRLSPGAEHAFTVLASNNLYNNKLNVGADFSWPQRPRWLFVDGRDERPPGLVIPQLDCPP